MSRDKFGQPRSEAVFVCARSPTGQCAVDTSSMNTATSAARLCGDSRYSAAVRIARCTASQIATVWFSLSLLNQNDPES